jgi:small subunit ribosomal protein S25e
MGGGKKKQSIKQMVKAQNIAQDKGKSKTKKDKPEKSSTATKKYLAIVAPNPKSKKVTKELEKLKVLTPYSVAQQLNLRLSIAKNLLSELNKQGNIILVSSGRNIKIYKHSN